MRGFNKIVICALAVFGFLSTSANVLYSQETIYNKVPKHLPIKVELLYDKGPKTLETLYIKVTNTGDKPIYYLDFILGTDEKSGLAIRYAVSWITFGRKEMRTLVNKANENDPYLAPQKNIILRPDKETIAIYRGGLKSDGIVDPGIYEFIFQVLSFGDGTGFNTTSGVPFPPRKKSTPVNVTKIRTKLSADTGAKSLKLKAKN